MARPLCHRLLNTAADPENGLWRLDPDGELTQVMEGGDTADAFPFPALIARYPGGDRTGPSLSGYSRYLPGRSAPRVSISVPAERLTPGEITPGCSIWKK